MNISFYAPMKALISPVPSGDLQVAKLFISAFELYGHKVSLASNFVSREPLGDPGMQEVLRLKGEKIASDLIKKFSNHSRPDLWFTYHVYYKAPDWIGPIVSKALGIPYVIAEASFAPKRASGPWKLSHEYCKRSISEADLIIGINSLDYKCIRPLLTNTSRYLQLRPFMNIPKYRRYYSPKIRRQLSKKFNIDAEKCLFLTVAMMREGAKYQSYELLARSLRLIKDGDWHLAIVGDGPRRNCIERAFKGLPVTFLGQLEQSFIFDLMAAADLFLWPAHNEAYGMAILESQSQGLPVIAGDVGGVGDIVRNNSTGILTKPDDVEEFSKAILKLIGDKNRLSLMSKQSRRIIASEHDLKHISYKLNLSINELIDDKVSPN